jgi:hypothetical protein
MVYIRQNPVQSPYPFAKSNCLFTGKIIMFFLLDEKEPKNQENMTLYGAPKHTFPPPVRHIFGTRSI